MSNEHVEELTNNCSKRTHALNKYMSKLVGM